MNKFLLRIQEYNTEHQMRTFIQGGENLYCIGEWGFGDKILALIFRTKGTKRKKRKGIQLAFLSFHTDELIQVFFGQYKTS